MCYYDGKEGRNVTHHFTFATTVCLIIAVVSLVEIFVLARLPKDAAVGGRLSRGTSFLIALVVTVACTAAWMLWLVPMGMPETALGWILGGVLGAVTIALAWLARGRWSGPAAATSGTALGLVGTMAFIGLATDKTGQAGIGVIMMLVVAPVCGWAVTALIGAMRKPAKNRIAA